MGFKTSDYNLEVRRSLVSGVSAVSVIGHSNDIGSSTETLMPGTGSISPAAIIATPSTVTISSDNANDTSAGTGLRTVQISGLNSSNVVTTEIVTMNGTTAVTSVNTYKWIQTLTAVSAGSGGVNAGTVYAGTGTVTAGKPAVLLCSMEVGANLSSVGAYMVPTGVSLYAEQLSISLGDTAKTLKVEIFIRSVATGLYVKATEYNVIGGFFIQPIVAFPAQPAGSVIEIRCTVDTGTASGTVALAGYLA